MCITTTMLVKPALFRCTISLFCSADLNPREAVSEEPTVRIYVHSANNTKMYIVCNMQLLKNNLNSHKALMH